MKQFIIDSLDKLSKEDLRLIVVAITEMINAGIKEE